MAESAAPTSFDTYTYVLLVRPDDVPDLPDDELMAIQEGHLRHLRDLTEAGHLLVAGPLSDQPDPSIRGVCIFATDRDQAAALMADDPGVRAGRFRADVMTWWTPSGSVTFPGR